MGRYLPEKYFNWRLLLMRLLLLMLLQMLVVFVCFLTPVNAVIPACVGAQKYPRLQIFPDAELSGYDDIMFEGVATFGGCIDKCEQTISVNCVSIDFGAISCSISSESKLTHPNALTPTIGYTHAIYTCEDVCPNGESGVWTASSAIMTGNDQASTQTVDLQECLLVCKNQSKFLCRFVEFESSTGNCRMSRDTLTTRPDLAVVSLGWTGHTFSCNRTCPPNVQRWVSLSSGLGADINNNSKIVLTPSADVCKEYCERESQFECNFVEFSSSLGRCRLNSETPITRPASTTTEVGYEYFIFCHLGKIYIMIQFYSA
ncbi:uncharacterized protein LOC141912920 [Tubulanus polymorphus]|uniref:uncharacterized protein LOC141912920 n=1 Tax=Tubulanus polymorphus TaxID=672921 RepID=UPI003DA2C85E